VTQAAAHAVRMGVFGGAFDPPHLAHRALVQAALEQLELDQLRVFPTGQAWHKPRRLSSAQHRLAMVRLAMAGLPRVLVDPRETLRDGPSYTVDTLRELQAEFPDAALFLLIGQDQAEALQSWHDWETVVRLAIICIAARADVTGSAAAFSPPAGLGARFLRLHFPLTPVSATQIRQQVAAGKGIAPLVGAAVARYIADNHLYQAT